jgi:hypothetical protein
MIALLVVYGLLAAAGPAAAKLAVYNPVFVGVSEGPYTGPITTFTDTVTTRIPSDYTATLLWSDDGTTSPGTITGSNGSFTISGSHTFGDEGTDSAYVTVTVNATMETQTVGCGFKISDADNFSGTPVQFIATAGVSFTMVVANFTDTYTGNQASDLESAIDWGDGTQTYPATTTGGGGMFSVSGTHTYTQAGRFSIQVTLEEDEGEFLNQPGLVTSVVDVIVPATPGLLRFSSGSYSAAESAGSATVTVARTDGSTGAVGVSYATSDGTGIAGRDYTPVSGTLSWANGDLAPKTFIVALLADRFLAASETVNLTLADPTGGAALASPSAAVLTITNGCGDSDQTLCLDGGRFRVQATWQTSGGSSGPGHALPLTNNVGTFWFFDPANVELFVKVLDGCALNGHFWFFAGGLTNVAVSLNVTDAQTGSMRTYTNQQGTAYPPLQDTNAFSTCP